MKTLLEKPPRHASEAILKFYRISHLIVGITIIAATTCIFLGWAFGVVPEAAWRDLSIATLALVTVQTAIGYTIGRMSQ